MNTWVKYSNGIMLRTECTELGFYNKEHLDSGLQFGLLNNLEYLEGLKLLKELNK